MAVVAEAKGVRRSIESVGESFWVRGREEERADVAERRFWDCQR